MPEWAAARAGRRKPAPADLKGQTSAGTATKRLRTEAGKMGESQEGLISSGILPYRRLCSKETWA